MFSFEGWRLFLKLGVFLEGMRVNELHFFVVVKILDLDPNPQFHTDLKCWIRTDSGSALKPIRFHNTVDKDGMRFFKLVSYNFL
jgi:hypothetical protein